MLQYCKRQYLHSCISKKIYVANFVKERELDYKTTLFKLAVRQTERDRGTPYAATVVPRKSRRTSPELVRDFVRPLGLYLDNCYLRGATPRPISLYRWFLDKRILPFWFWYKLLSQSCYFRPFVVFIIIFCFCTLVINVRSEQVSRCSHASHTRSRLYRGRHMQLAKEYQHLQSFFSL